MLAALELDLIFFFRYVEMTAVMQKIQEDAKKKEDEKWERKREVQVKKIKENGIYDKVSRIKEPKNILL